MSDFSNVFIPCSTLLPIFFRQAVGFVDNMHDTAADSYTVLTDGLSVLPDFRRCNFRCMYCGCYYLSDFGAVIAWMYCITM